jgi:heat shock protein HslJ
VIRKSVLLATACALIVVGGACGSSDGSSSGGGSGDASSLDGTDWVLIAMTPPVPGLADVTVTAKFASGRLSGHSGCNTYGTSFTQDGNSLTFGKDIATTRIACPSGPSRVEQAYLDRLAKVASVSRSGGALVLKDADGSRILTYTAAPSGAAALIGDWEVTGFYSGTAISSPIVDSRLTATFTEDDVNGNSGCNTFRGPTEVDGSAITIGPLASTAMACADPEVDQQAQQYTAALGAAKSFEVVGDRLSLYRADGGYAVTFERA